MYNHIDVIDIEGFNCSYITYERENDIYEYINRFSITQPIPVISKKVYDLKDSYRALMRPVNNKDIFAPKLGRSEHSDNIIACAIASDYKGVATL